MPKYTIGLDFGTLSGRAVLIDVANGRVLASASHDFAHGVMDISLPGGRSLPADFALQHPQDYLDVLSFIVHTVIEKSGVDPSDIIGVGSDFTACSLLPVQKDGTPLCFLPQYQDEPHAYVKLWKHHAASKQAAVINRVAAERNEPWLARYGGKISSEWAFPKIWEVLEHAPEIYDAADQFIEAGDWLTWQLTGIKTRNACAAGYKAMWSKHDGFPGNAFFKALDSRLEHVVDQKLSRLILPLGSKAGEITESAAKLTGLAAQTAVAVSNIDAHACFPAVGINGPGKVLTMIGTSTCHLLLDDKEIPVEGICGVVEDGVIPGFFGYEAGQCCVGDHFQWFIERCLPEQYASEAALDGKNIHQYLREKAQPLKPGQSGLIALDWWNGNRSILVDVDLSGVIIGMTLATRPEEIYRALIEATAYGTKIILDTFRSKGIPINKLYASGGIAQKDGMTMQIYADVLNMPIRVAGSEQGAALGSAIFASLAAGSERGGYDTVSGASQKMAKCDGAQYYPIAENAAVYEKLYAEYKILHDYFGRGGNDVMKRLKKIKESQ